MKINIHISTYIFLLISFLSGYFEYMYLFLITIFIHEYGHFLFGLLVGYKNTIINIYPFGGITQFNTDLNTPIYKEFISLIGGLLFQIVFLILINKLFYFGYITNHVYIILSRINFILISFNFMPVLPLDGGRLLFLIIEKIKGSPVKPKVENMIHTIGFVLLMALILLISFNDILKIFK